MPKDITIKIDGLDALVRKFEGAQEKVKRELVAALTEAATDIQSYARTHHRFVSRSSKTETEGIRADVDGAALVGRVYLDTAVAAFQHEGTGLYGPNRRAITIRPRNRKALRWQLAGGSGFAFAKKAVNPGIKPDPYLYNAAEVMRPGIIARFDATVKKLIE
jgi:hypothetical protein